MVNTTQRTIALASVLRESQAEEAPQTTLPGGTLDNSYILENQLWLDRDQEPEGAIKWTTSLASYASSRASEYALFSSLHHSSFAKVLKQCPNPINQIEFQNIGLLILNSVEEYMKF